MRRIARDPFARTTLVRRIIATLSACTWCGFARGTGTLFEYGTEHDARSRIDWHAGAFCSVGCHNAFHR